jgi:hypothetical protein
MTPNLLEYYVFWAAVAAGSLVWSIKDRSYPAFSTTLFLFLLSAPLRVASGWSLVRLFQKWALILHGFYRFLQLLHLLWLCSTSRDYDKQFRALFELATINGIKTSIAHELLFHAITYGVSCIASNFADLKCLIVWFLPAYILVYALHNFDLLPALSGSREVEDPLQPVAYIFDLHNWFFETEHTLNDVRKQCTDSGILFGRWVYDGCLQMRAKLERILLATTAPEEINGRSFRRSTELFEYIKLDAKPSSQFRLLKIKPLWRQSWPFILGMSEELECNLIQVSLDSDKVPHYESLSHFWGQGTEEVNIRLNGKVFSARKSVHDILVALVPRWRRRYLWVDSICIDQHALEERGAQVQIMRDIYHRSSKVIVWLKDTYNARHSRRLLQQYCVGLNHRTEAEVKAEYRRREDRLGWRALMNLYNHSWFHRVWVVQEVSMAKEVFIQLDKQIPWEVLSRVTGRLQIEPPEFSFIYNAWDDWSQQLYDFRGMINTFQNITQISNCMRTIDQIGVNSLSLGNVLFLGTLLNATDPRDKVYGLLGLSKHHKIKALRPNYHLSVVDVYAQAAVALTQLGEPEVVLTLAGIGFSRKFPGLPSWVPDWTNRVRRAFLADCSAFDLTRGYRLLGPAGTDQLLIGSGLGSRYRYIAAAGVEPSIEVLDQGKTLAVVGQLLDRLTAIGSPIDIPDGLEDIEKELMLEEHFCDNWDFLSSTNDLKVDGTHADLDRFFDMYWHTIVGGERILMTAMNPGFFRYRRYCIEILSRHRPDLARLLKDPGKPFSEDDARRISWLLRWYAQGRRLGLTEGGRLGMVPPLSAVDDLVCLFNGFQTPFIVRLVPEDKLSENSKIQPWYFVGECYMRGLMLGEMNHGNDLWRFVLI